MDNDIAGTIYVTGATGFIGEHVVRELIQNGNSVTLLSRSVAKTQNRLSDIDELNIRRCDVTENNQTLQYNPTDILLHCAWASVDDVMSSKHIDEEVSAHYRFLRNAVEHGLRRLIVTGTFFEYGLQYGPVYRTTKTTPNTPYGVAKDSLHKYIRQLQHNHEFDLVWLRLFYVYARQGNKRGLFAALEKALLDGDKNFPMSTGDQLLDYLDVKAVAHEIKNSLCWENGTYNICSGKPESLRSIVQKWLDKNGQAIKLNCGLIPNRKFESQAIWGGDPNCLEV